MRPIYMSVAGAGTSVPIPLDKYLAPFHVTLVVEDSSGSISATVEWTADDVFAPGYDPGTGQWFPHTDLTDVTSATSGTIISPVSAVRLVNADTGTAKLTVIQAGVQ